MCARKIAAALAALLLALAVCARPGWARPLEAADVRVLAAQLQECLPEKRPWSWTVQAQPPVRGRRRAAARAEAPGLSAQVLWQEENGRWRRQFFRLEQKG